MTTAFYPTTSYKPQVLSRTEGFHLPSPAPSTPPSADNTPGGSSSNGSSNPNNTSNFDTHNLFITPPSYLSVPETFRKFPGPSPDNGSSMDFTEELASLINNPAPSASSGHHHHPSSHERSTHSPANGYDEYRSHTHNIFDISAPTSHHSHHTSHHTYAPSSSAFSLPPTSSLHHNSLHHSQSSTHHAAGSMHNHNSHGLHEFATHSHFNSTVPAIGSSMRYDPPGSSHGPPPGGEPSSVSSFTSHISGISSLSNLSNITTTSESFHHHNGGGNQMRQTPSPVSGQTEFGQRSRSRSRTSGSGSGASAAGVATDPANPPSTNGGPARRTRTKRNSVSSVSPPPLQRHTQPLVIPGANGTNGRGPASPLSLHTNGWFMPTNSNQQGAEFSLPTPESVHGGFSSFSNPLGVSPKDVNGLVLNNVGGVGLPGAGLNGLNGTGNVTTVSMKGESPPTDMAVKQALLANEKRRRRRESHNAVERRRRDNINEKISELATLIPECLLDPAATPSNLPLNEDGLLSPTSPGGFDDDEKELKDSVKDGAKESPSSASANGKESKDGAGIKANKGMILRKSVEYIRYLQQLVSAQASRNRDLEQQLQTYRSGGVPSASPTSSPGAGLVPGSAVHGNATGDDEMSLLLHDEVDGLQLPNALSTSPTSGHRRSGSSGTRKFNGFELERVDEMDMEDDVVAKQQHYSRHDGDDHDEDMDRPSTMGGMSVSLSPSGSGSYDGDEHTDDHDHEASSEGDDKLDGDEGERGRRMGRGGILSQQGLVKVKEEGVEMLS